jgi:hypothetical protein
VVSSNPVTRLYLGLPKVENLVAGRFERIVRPSYRRLPITAPGRWIRYSHQPTAARFALSVAKRGTRIETTPVGLMPYWKALSCGFRGERGIIDCTRQLTGSFTKILTKNALPSVAVQARPKMCNPLIGL